MIDMIHFLSKREKQFLAGEEMSRNKYLIKHRLRQKLKLIPNLCREIEELLNYNNNVDTAIMQSLEKLLETAQSIFQKNERRSFHKIERDDTVDEDIKALENW